MDSDDDTRTRRDSTTKSDHAFVDATGTVRRLRALVAIGYPQIVLAARLNMAPGDFSRILHAKRPRVAEKTYSSICELFTELWAHPVQGRPGDRSRSLAKSRKWVGPLAWDDIDDPRETPNIRGRKPLPTEQELAEEELLEEIELGIEFDPDLADLIDEIAIELAMNGEPVKLTKDERWQAVTRLHSRRWSDKYIAATLRITDRTVLRIRQRLELEAFDFSEIRQVESA